ncbi:MAG: CinA family protein [Gammaproteobacteria bacterium]|nr:CinA family protein [Gammaproteobacteria bacterium]
MELGGGTATTIGKALTARKETVSIAESTTGGLIAAQLLAVPGASAYFLGGSVVYTLASRRAFLDLPANTRDLEPLSEPMAEAFASAARDKLGATWGIAELGVAGPSGSRYGHPPGTTVIGVVGPVTKTTTALTGSDDRTANMEAFAVAALEALNEAIRESESQ